MVVLSNLANVALHFKESSFTFDVHRLPDSRLVLLEVRGHTIWALSFARGCLDHSEVPGHTHRFSLGMIQNRFRNDEGITQSLQGNRDIK